MESEVKKDEEIPLVSVVVPCYNHEKYVKETIESIVNQTYKNIELIVIDDGSIDNSVKIIQELANKYNFTFIHRPNKGLSATLNEGIKLSKGKYFCVCASDDMYMPDKIEKQVEFMENTTESNIAGVAGYVCLIKKGKVVKLLKKKYTMEKYSFQDILKHKFYLPAPTSFFRRDILIKVGGFDEDTSLEDWAIYLKLTYNGYLLIRLPYVMVYYRRHKSNYSNDIKNMDYARKKLLSKYRMCDGFKFANKRLEFITAIHYLKRYDFINGIIYLLKFIFKEFINNRPKGDFR